MKKQDHNTKKQKLHEIKEMMWNTQSRMKRTMMDRSKLGKIL